MIGVVLAGGESRRLGHDKVRLSVHGGNSPDMLTRTARLLAGCTDGIVVSCRASRDVRPYRCIPDVEEGLGPFGGLYSVLRVIEEPVLVLSCDLPFMTEALLQRLIHARNNRKAQTIMTTFQQEETGFIEALVAVYEPACLPFFEQARREGIRKLSRVIPEPLRMCIPYTESESLPFFNINYPEDLAQARRLAQKL